MFSVMFHVMIITGNIIMIIVLVFQMIIGVHNWMMMTAIISIVAGVVVEVVPGCVVVPNIIQIIPLRFLI
jgi:hypothetical protein